MERVAEDNSKSNENGKKFSKRVENTVEKKDLLIMSNFSVSHSDFKRRVLMTQI